MGQFTFVGNALVAYEGDEAEVKIPPEINCIGKHAFKDCTSLECVVWLGGFSDERRIETGAFDGCTGLVTVDIQSGLREKKLLVSASAFDRCSRLSSLRIPGSQPDFKARDIFSESMHPALRVVFCSEQMHKSLKAFAPFFKKLVRIGYAGYKPPTVMLQGPKGLWCYHHPNMVSTPEERRALWGVAPVLNVRQLIWTVLLIGERLRCLAQQPNPQLSALPTELWLIVLSFNFFDKDKIKSKSKSSGVGSVFGMLAEPPEPPQAAEPDSVDSLQSTLPQSVDSGL